MVQHSMKKSSWSVIVVALFISNELHGQTYSFSEIMENFLRERPETGDPAVREDCFGGALPDNHYTCLFGPDPGQLNDLGRLTIRLPY